MAARARRVVGGGRSKARLYSGADAPGRPWCRRAYWSGRGLVNRIGWGGPGFFI